MLKHLCITLALRLAHRAFHALLFPLFLSEANHARSSASSSRLPVRGEVGWDPAAAPSFGQGWPVNSVHHDWWCWWCFMISRLAIPPASGAHFLHGALKLEPILINYFATLFISSHFTLDHHHPGNHHSSRLLFPWAAIVYILFMLSRNAYIILLITITSLISDHK